MKNLIFLSLYLFFSFCLYSQNTNSVNEQSKPAGSVAPKVNSTPKADMDNQKMEQKESLSKSKKSVTPVQADGEAANYQQKIAQANTQLSKSYTAIKKMETSRTANSNQLNSIKFNLATLKAYAPESFEYHFYTYFLHRFDKNYLAQLTNAQQLNPSNESVKTELFAAYLANGYSKQMDSILKTTSSSSGLSSYYKDLLESTPQKGTLIIHGTNDLELLMNEQKKLNRSDVKLIAFDLLASDAYRKKWTNEGYKFPNSTIIDTSYLKEFCQLNPGKKLFLSLNFPSNYFKSILQKIQLNGLTFAYASEQKNTIQLNYEYYKTKINPITLSSIQNDNSDALASNYLPCLLMAKRYLTNQQNEIELEKINELIRQVANRSGKSQELKQVVE